VLNKFLKTFNAYDSHLVSDDRSKLAVFRQLQQYVRSSKVRRKNLKETYNIV